MEQEVERKWESWTSAIQTQGTGKLLGAAVQTPVVVFSCGFSKVVNLDYFSAFYYFLAFAKVSIGQPSLESHSNCIPENLLCAEIVQMKVLFICTVVSGVNAMSPREVYRSGLC